MRRERRLKFCLIALSTLPLVMFGCKSGEVSYSSGNMKHTSSVKEAGVPEDLKTLMYPGATTGGVQTAQEEGKDSADYSKYMQLVSTDSVEKVAQWYEQTLKNEGWNIEKNEQMSKTISLEGRMKESEISVTMVDDSGSTNIIVSKSASSGAIPDEESIENYKPNKEVTPTD